MPPLNQKYLVSTAKFFSGVILGPVIMDLLGEPFNSEEFMTAHFILQSQLPPMLSSIDYANRPINPYSFDLNEQYPLIANTPKQLQYVKEKNQFYKQYLDDALHSKKLDAYPGIKSFVEMTAGYVNDAGNGIDTYGEMLTLPSYTFVEEFADWIFEKDPEHPKSTKEIDDMLIDMGYRDLWQEMTSRAKLDLEIKSLGNTLSEEQQQDYKNKLVTSNNRMIGIFEKQISDEAEAKYADFFNNYDFNVKGDRGVQTWIDHFSDLNKGLENGWDVTHYKDYVQFKKISRDCSKALQFMEHYDVPELETFRQLSQKVAANDPTDKKFANAAECEAFVKQFGADLQDLIFEAKRPNVSQKLQEIINDADQKYTDYSNYCSERKNELELQKSDPTVQVRPEIAPPITTKSKDNICRTLKDGDNSKSFCFLEQYARQLDPEKYKIAQQEYTEQKRESDIVKLSGKIMEESGTLMPDIMEDLAKKPSFYQFNHEDSWAFTSFRDRTKDLNDYLSKNHTLLSMDSSMKTVLDPEFKRLLLNAFKASEYYQKSKRTEAGIAMDAEWEGPSSPMGKARYEAAQKIEQFARKYILDDIAKSYQEDEVKAHERERFNETRSLDHSLTGCIQTEMENALQALTDKINAENLMGPSGSYERINRTEKLENEFSRILALRVVQDIYNSGKVDVTTLQEDDFLHDVSSVQKEIQSSSDFNVMIHGLQSPNGEMVIEPLEFEHAVRMAQLNQGRGLANRLSEYRKNLLKVEKEKGITAPAPKKEVNTAPKEMKK